MGRSPIWDLCVGKGSDLYTKKTPTRGGGAYSGISIHASHTGTTAHSYAVLGLVVYWFFRFPLCVIGRPLSLNLNEAEPKEKAERRWQNLWFHFILSCFSLSPPLNRWANTFTFSTEYSLSQILIRVN